MEDLVLSFSHRRRGETLGAGDGASTSVVGSAFPPTNLSAAPANISVNNRIAFCGPVLCIYREIDLLEPPQALIPE
jgi:hypothetical protein